MSKRHATCPRCGLRIEFLAVLGQHIVCPNCQAGLTVLGKGRRRWTDDALVGRRLGRYEVCELLGRGGMGSVYKARQLSPDRFVALKILPRSADAEAVARLRREARAAAAVRHPNIIGIYGLGRLCGRHYIAMEFVDGESLEERLHREGYLEPERALGLMKQVTSALAKAHDAGIIHRDIKPSNILLTARGKAKVADFGLAKRPELDPRAGRRRPALGTPHYISPEAALGRPLDARSDLYSLGATFYHALSGRPPFRGNSDTGLLAEHAEGDPLPLQEARPDLPHALCQVVHRLLCKEPARRFQTAYELLDALDVVDATLRAMDTEATVILAWDALPGVERPRARGRRGHPVAWLAGFGLAAAVALLIALVALGRRAESSEPGPERTAPAHIAHPSP